MDDGISISLDKLNTWRGVFPPPLVIDLRRRAAYDEASAVIPGAIYRDPERLATWAPALELGRAIVVYCVRGHEVSQEAAAALRERGFVAGYLEGGIEAWAARGLPLAPKPPVKPSLWVTRERPKIDRIACPWLIRRFIDADAQFLYVPPGEVLSVAGATGAVPYDIPGVELSHVGESCSFDAFIRRYGLGDPALGRVAEIVRGADTSHLSLTAQSAGLFAISLGLSAVFADDQRMLRHGLIVYDALYAWCRSLQGETHSWPPAMPAAAEAAR
ncbi:MAG TPA: chromate resistance protein ChrB domain-containing protein [Alphaproteobacteria bacterium]|nr:chromate resistance protein ChrB domain-containing protein [Alphaproteobacteria bacterium]